MNGTEPCVWGFRSLIFVRLLLRKGSNKSCGIRVELARNQGSVQKQQKEFDEETCENTSINSIIYVVSTKGLRLAVKRSAVRSRLSPPHERPATLRLQVFFLLKDWRW